MKKVIGLVLLITILFSISFIHASEEDDIEKAYQCLQNRIAAKGCSTMTVEEKAFSLLALQDFGTCQNELKSNQGTTIKQKSLSLLALKAVGENTTAIEAYLLSQKIIPSGISWYLQVETKGAASCEAFYDNSIKTFSIAANKKLSGNAGGCLSAGSNIKNGYWFLIAPSCHGKTFEISCEGEGRFLTNLLYQEDGSTTIFVSEKTHTAPSGGVTSERIDSYCFRQGATSTCDYEGSLWATLALDYVGKDVSSFIPYLMAKAGSNVHLLPESFLYYLTEFPEYQSSIFAKQGKFSNNKYWSVSGDKAYDTALALLPFRGESLQQKTDAKSSLLKLRDNNGCWSENAAGTIKNTAFVLYSMWPELVPPAPECTKNATCVDLIGAGAYCSNGECVEGNQQQCANNATCVEDLGAGAYCSNGVCYEPEDTGCTTDPQCVAEHGTGWVCSSGHECILEEDECTPATEDVDCGPEQRCTNGACEDRPDVIVPICGDGIIQQPNSNGVREDCDGNNIQFTSCTTQGFNNQTSPLSCYSNCTLNITGCFNSPTDECSPPTRNCTGVNSTCENGHCVPPPSTNLSVCGNGIAQAGEACDGNDWRDVDSCTDFLDYDFGNVSCNNANSTAACQFNTTLCYANDVCIEDEDCADEGEDYECVYGQCLPPIVDECDDDEFCEEEYGNDYECVFGKCDPKDGGGGDLPDCEDDFGYSCRSNNACLNDDGEVLDQYSCSSSSGICCSVDTSILTCDNQFGDICNSNQQCSGGTPMTTGVSDLDLGEICCVGGTCQSQDEETSDCEWYDGECKTSCGSGETESSDDCEDVYGSGYVCCVESGTPPPPSSGGSLLWLWILLVLIVFVVLGIVFRDKLRIAFMKLKSGRNNPPSRPGFPPPGMMSNRPIPRRILPPSAPSPPPRPMLPRGPPPRASPQGKPPQKPKSDLDDVLKKLKEMGK